MPEVQRVKQPLWPALQTRLQQQTPLITVATIAETHRNTQRETGRYNLLIQVMHIFNPSPREVYKWEGTALRHSLILRFLKAKSPFQTEVEVRASG